LAAWYVTIAKMMLITMLSMHRDQSTRAARSWNTGGIASDPGFDATMPFAGWSLTKMALSALAKKFAKAAVPARMRLVGVLSHLNRVRGASR
jgi:hypothetical protein